MLYLNRRDFKEKGNQYMESNQFDLSIVEVCAHFFSPGDRFAIDDYPLWQIDPDDDEVSEIVDDPKAKQLGEEVPAEIISAFTEGDGPARMLVDNIGFDFRFVGEGRVASRFDY